MVIFQAGEHLDGTGDIQKPLREKGLCPVSEHENMGAAR
jgi:hypothetical protein